MIPKIIHYCWFGGKPLPESACRCIASWRKFCPDYEIRQWNESNVDFSTVDYMREAFEEKAWGFVPDVARLQIIYSYGGIYLDTDVEIVKSFDPLLNNSAFMGIEAGSFDKGTIALGLGFGAEKGNELIGFLLNGYQKLHFREDNGKLNRISAPQLQLPLFIEKGFNQKDEFQVICGTAIYPSDFFCPLSLKTGILTITQNTYSIHQYDGSWFTEKERNIVKTRQSIYQKWGRLAGLVWFLKHVEMKMKVIGIRKMGLLVFTKLKSYIRK